MKYKYTHSQLQKPQAKQKIKAAQWVSTFGIIILSASILFNLQTQTAGPCSTTFERLHATGQWQSDGQIRIHGTDLAPGDASIYIYNLTTATLIANTSSPASSYTINGLQAQDYDIQIRRADASNTIYCDETTTISIGYYAQGSGTCSATYNPSAYAYGAIGWNHNANDPAGQVDGHRLPNIYNNWWVSSADQTDYEGLSYGGASSQIEVQIEDASAEEAILNGRYAEYRFTTTNNVNEAAIISGIGFSIYDSINPSAPATGRYKIQVQLDDDADFGSPTIFLNQIQIDNEDPSVDAFSSNLYTATNYTHTHNFYRADRSISLQANTTYYLRVYFFDRDRAGYSPSQSLSNSILWDDVRIHLEACQDNDNDLIGDETDIDDDNDGLTDLVENGCVDGAYFIGWWHNNPYADAKQDGFSRNPNGGPTYYWAASQMGADTAVVSGQGTDLIIGPGFSSHKYPGSLLTLYGADQNDFNSAFSDQDYIQYSFDTRTGFQATLDRFGFAVGDNSAGDARTSGHTLSLLVSDDNFSSYDTLILDHFSPLSSTWYEYREIDLSKYSYSLNANSTYTFRLYLYNAPAANLDSVNVDDIQFSAIFCRDTDQDGVMDYLDLDSDNDGIPDLGEAGGTDINGDGLADNLLDLDQDGLMDQFETSDGSTSILTDQNGDGINTEGDFDGDGLPNWLDLDSDGDGIVDVFEANGTDNDQDGLIDNWATDNDNDGLADGVDSDNGNNNDAENTSIALMLTNADANGDAFPDGAYPRANFDTKGKPDFLDIDSDDDGITDNTEAQSTNIYLAPSNVDSDLDGIDNAYDSSPYSFGGANINPANTDNVDEYDFRDLNSDNDAESDLIEGHDTNGDGSPDGNAASANGSATNVDSDEDGLDDGFDNSIGSTDPTNGGLNPLSFPRVDGGSDRDWRVDILLPVQWLAFEAKWQAENVILEWQVIEDAQTQTYIIERKNQLSNAFEQLSSMDAKGLAQEVRYQFNDEKASRFGQLGILYYRIKQVDVNGQFQYSNVVALASQNTQADLSVYPNPAKHKIQIQIEGQITVGDRLKVYNQEGRIVHSEVISNTKLRLYSLDIEDWTAGFYLIQLTGEHSSIAKKLKVN
ncbi:MAG: T9SS type A sorting domain-containing protein [Bacteroidota bacterium]